MYDQKTDVALGAKWSDPVRKLQTPDRIAGAWPAAGDRDVAVTKRKAIRPDHRELSIRPRFLTLATLLLAVVAPRATIAEAFPGAQGFGANAKGGRGGVVHEVVNLLNSGPGSLRACVEASGPRTCVFRVDGTIELASPLLAQSPELTIAGQTAPGGGVALRLAAAPTYSATPLIISGTHDVIVRHIRLRPGPSANRAATDALTVANSHDVIIDHVSMSWAPDENLNAHETVYNLTVQWSVLAEGLLDHSKGSLSCSTSGWQCRDITLHHNLYVSNRDRNPDVKTAPSGQLDFVNNVVHNPKSAYVEVWTPWGDSWTNIVANTFRKGPDTNSWAHAVRYNNGGATGVPTIHVAQNVSEVPLVAPGTEGFVVGQPFATLSVSPESAAVAYDKVLAQVGAWPRDAVDTRLVDEVRNRRGQLIMDPSQLGGWPALRPGAAPADQDHDGMPDRWERARGLNARNAADRNLDHDADGYTNLEEYLDERASSLVGAPGPRGG
jgi:pectate lyase